VFHDRATASGYAQSPRLDRLVAGTKRVDVEPDRATCLGVGRQLQCLGEVLWGATVQTAVGKCNV